MPDALVDDAMRNARCESLAVCSLQFAASRLACGVCLQSLSLARESFVSAARQGSGRALLTTFAGQLACERRRFASRALGGARALQILLTRARARVLLRNLLRAPFRVLQLAVQRRLCITQRRMIRKNSAANRLARTRIGYKSRTSGRDFVCVYPHAARCSGGGGGGGDSADHWSGSSGSRVWRAFAL